MTYDTKGCRRPMMTAALFFLLALVSPLAAQVPPCGDGTLDLGEQCDEGPATGAPDSCCDIGCMFRPASTPCRDTTGECDPADVCSGTSGVCVDVKRTDVCRPSAGVCDLGESCDGVANDCPADDFVPSTSECRASVDVCDVAEHCTGSSASCPSDGFASAAVECRADVGGCDVAEYCTGGNVSCPADGFEPDETPCDDANVCSSNDRCIGGVCGGFLQSCGNGTLEGSCLEECDDGNQTAGDGCTESCQLEPCGPEPLDGCRAPATEGRAFVKIFDRPNDEKNRLQWKWAPGATTPKADFGDPTDTTSYQFCIYEEVGGDPRLSASYAIPAAGVCGTGPCWRSSGSGFKYIDKFHASDGISSLILKEGLTPGKSKILLKGRGASLPMPVLPMIQSPNVVMQLKASTGVCWETRYEVPAFSNLPDQFRDN